MAIPRKQGIFGSETLEPELIVLKFKNMSTLVWTNVSYLILLIIVNFQFSINSESKTIGYDYDYDYYYYYQFNQN